MANMTRAGRRETPARIDSRDGTTMGGTLPACVTSLLFRGFLACDGGLEAGASREARHRRRGDLDLGAGLRVAASTRCALGRLESTEADEGHGVAFRHGLDDRIKDCVERSASGGFADVCLGCGDFDQFGFVHKYPFVG